MIGINRGLWLAAATAMVFAVGCGDNNNPDAGSGCSTDANCGTGKACHPVLKECVSTCTGASDCPASEKTCDSINGSTAKFCKCSTDALCNTSVAGNICSTATFQCTAKCTANSNCPSGSTCDTASGQCKGDNTDAGMDAGTMDAGTACNNVGICTYPQVCDFTAGRCKAGATCNTANTQPDTCGYAGYCSVNSNCAQVSPPTCTNFPSGSAPLAWNPASSTGPVIIGMTQVLALTSDGFCSAGAPVHGKIKVNAYDPGGNLDGETSQPALTYYRTTGSPLSITMAEIQAYMSQANGNAATFDVNFCAPTGTTSLTVALAFANGNGACFTLTN